MIRLLPLFTLLPACAWTPTDPWPYMAGVVLFYVGLALGTWIEAREWRAKGDAAGSYHQVNDWRLYEHRSARMESAGKIYWVCLDSAPKEAREFVAHMLLAEREEGGRP